VNPAPDIAGRKPCVLVVDDERDNRELLSLILSWEGFTVVSAPNGEEALASVAAQPPDLILLDVMMPGLDGYQVASRIKSDLVSKAIPIILVTAVTDSNARARGRSSGAEDFLAKPVDRDQLVMQVRKLLRETYPDYRDAT
jgi:CheY-like chemotaxis protein